MLPSSPLTRIHINVPGNINVSAPLFYDDYGYVNHGYGNFNGGLNQPLIPSHPYDYGNHNYILPQPSQHIHNVGHPNSGLAANGIQNLNADLLSSFNSDNIGNFQVTNTIGTSNNELNPNSLTPVVNRDDEKNPIPIATETKDPILNGNVEIKFWNVIEVIELYKPVHKVPDVHKNKIYYCFSRKVKSTGEVNLSIDYTDVKKIFPEVKFLDVYIEEEKTGETIKFNEYELCKLKSIPIETDKLRYKRICFLFRDKNRDVEFKIYLYLKDVSKISKKRDEIINDFIENYGAKQDDSVKESLKEMFKTLKELKKEIFEEEKEERIDNFLKFRDFISDKVKDKTEAKKLLISCFDALYKFIYQMDEDDHQKEIINLFDNSKYIQFLKEYFPGNHRQNNIVNNRIVITKYDLNGIVITKNDLNGNKRKYGSKKENEDLRENEDLKKEKKQKVDTNGTSDV